MKRTAVLGGGLQGCCIALALAERGVDVTLYDRHAALLSGAAAVNEGKIHLGYVYAADASRMSARTMARGALAFAPFMRHHVDTQISFCRSTPFVYLVHRDSQKSSDNIAAYLSATHADVLALAAETKGDYFGINLRDAPRLLSKAAHKALFDPHCVAAAFATPEIAVDPLSLARSIRARIAADSKIGLRLRRTVLAVEDDGARLAVISDGPDGGGREAYDIVVNALWDGRHKIDVQRGARPRRPWLHRLKYGIRFRPPPAAPALPSVTIVLGPFGDVVNYEDGSVYLSWYPACMRDHSTALVPPDWPSEPDATLGARMVADSFAALGGIVPALQEFDVERLPELAVRGGVIVAWGETDIDDPFSLLHRRYEIGVSSEGRYHSVDPGKYTMAPYFAGVCADRIVQV
jgi:glycine/D-amino acid oxidase-like deaminating enzyme